jgi:hypothetical protein
VSIAVIRGARIAWTGHFGVRNRARFLIEVMQPKPADDYRLNEASGNEMVKPQIEARASPHVGVLAERKTGFVILTNAEGGTALIWTDLLLVDGVVFA